MRILIACEFSGVVRDAFSKRGHDVWSCDLLPAEGKHIQGDVLDVLEDGWDMMIAHPPCTYLARSGLHWNKRVEGREEKTHEAMLFVFNLIGEGFVHNPIPRICIENPVGRIATAYRPPDQIIQPFQFGDNASKKTCLWLKNLPKIKPTSICKPRVIGDGQTDLLGDGIGTPRWENQMDSGQNKLGETKDRWMKRSVTYPGIAQAMAEQWG